MKNKITGDFFLDAEDEIASAGEIQTAGSVVKHGRVYFFYVGIKKVVTLVFKSGSGLIRYISRDRR